VSCAVDLGCLAEEALALRATGIWADAISQRPRCGLVDFIGRASERAALFCLEHEDQLCLGHIDGEEWWGCGGEP